MKPRVRKVSETQEKGSIKDMWKKVYIYMINDVYIYIYDLYMYNKYKI